MELLQLKYFCYSAKTENFSKTAKKYMIPSSAVSQSIRRLENELGVSKNHPIANKENINFSELFNENFITMHQSAGLYHLTHLFCANAGFKPKISIQCDDPFYMRKYIEMGLGIGFVPTLSWKGQISCDIVLKKLDLLRTTYVFYDTKRYMQKAVSEFLNVLIELCQSYALKL